MKKTTTKKNISDKNKNKNNRKLNEVDQVMRQKYKKKIQRFSVYAYINIPYMSAYKSTF